MREDHRFESVRDAIADTPARAATLRLRSPRVIALRDHSAREGLTQIRAAAILGVTPPRVSDPVRGRIDPFAIESLATKLAAAGSPVELRVARAAWWRTSAAWCPRRTSAQGGKRSRSGSC